MWLESLKSYVHWKQPIAICNQKNSGFCLQICLLAWVLGQLPTEDKSPPDKNKAQSLPTGTTIPRTIPHQDNSPLGPQNKPTHQDQIPVWWGIVQVGSCPDMPCMMWLTINLCMLLIRVRCECFWFSSTTSPSSCVTTTMASVMSSHRTASRCATSYCRHSLATCGFQIPSHQISR